MTSDQPAHQPPHSASTPDGSTASAASTGAAGDLAAVADMAAHRVALAGGVPGLTFAVASPTGLQHAGAVGYADLAARRTCTVADRFPWFSMTKIATATAAMRLHENGVVDVNAPIDTYLEEDFELRGTVVGGQGVPTLRQLLTHTAGLRNPLPVRWVRPAGAPADPEAVTRLLAKYGAARRQPGGRAAYSNIGYLLAGRVLETVTGSSVEALLQQLVLDPLGMCDTGFAVDQRHPSAVGYVRVPRAAVPALRTLLPRGIVGGWASGYTAFEPFLVTGAAYGGLIGTVTDAVRLAAAHLASDDASPGGHRLLTAHTLQLMRSIDHPGKPFDHGIGWFRKRADADRQPDFVEHYGTGGGFWNAMRIYPSQGLAMVAMTNTTTAWNCDRLFTQLHQLTWT